MRNFVAWSRQYHFRFHRKAVRVLSASYWRLTGVSVGSYSNVNLFCAIKPLGGVSVGKYTSIERGCFLQTLSIDGRISIGSHCILSPGVQVFAGSHIIIEDFAMIGGNTHIADTTHCYSAGDIPYRIQGLTDPLPVVVHKGAWIGQNCVIMPGCSIGANSIVGASSVVTRPIPAHSIAVGSPAKVIKTFSADTRQWIPTGSS